MKTRTANVINVILISYFIICFQSITFGQELCEKDQNTITVAELDSEFGPKPNLSKKELTAIINSNVNILDFPNTYSRDFGVIFFVNCRGEDFNYQFYPIENGKRIQDSTSTFQKQIIDCLDSNLDWKPGTSNLSNNGFVPWRQVDYQSVIHFNVKRNKIKILDKF